MATPIWLTGFEHGATPTANGAGLFVGIIGSPSIQSSVKNTGLYAIQFNNASAVASYVEKSLGGNQTNVVGRLYFRYDTLPGVRAEIVMHAGSAMSGPRIMLNPANSKVYVAFGATGGIASNMTISLGQWYRLEWRVIVSGTTATIDWKIDETDQTQLIDTVPVGGVVTNTRLGFNTATTGNLYIDDVVLSTTPADYPIGPGGTQLRQPSADGTHVPGTNVIEDQAGNDIGAVTAYDKLNSVPASAATYIRQAATGAGNYAEVLIEDLTDAHSAVIGAQAILAYTSATTSSNKAACIISKDDFATFTPVWGAPGTGLTADYSDGATTNLYYKSAVIQDVADDTTANNLKARLGYSDDASPNPYWVDLFVEVAYTTSTEASSSASVSLTGEAGQVAADADVIVGITASITGTGSVAADADNPVAGALSLSGGGSVSSNVSVAVSAVVSGVGNSVVSMQAGPIAGASIAVGGAGSVNAQADLPVSGSIAATGVGLVSIAAQVTNPSERTAEIATGGSGAVSVSVSVPVAASLNLQGGGLVSAAAGVKVSGALALSGQGSVHAVANDPVGASVAVSGGGQVHMDAEVARLDVTATITARAENGDVSAFASVDIAASAELTGSGMVSALTNVAIDAALSLGSNGRVTILVGINAPDGVDIVIHDHFYQTTLTEHAITADMISRDLQAQMSVDEINAGMTIQNLQATLTEV